MALSPDPAQWWRTAIIDIAPGSIRVRGYAIEELIGAVSFPEMVWLMLRGDLPSPDQGALLGAVLVAAVDHGPQAPSIAIARMAMTCGVGVNNAMASAVNALGDVHGGAGQQGMALYAAVAGRAGSGIALGAAAGAEIGARLLRREHVPGFGHRFHPVDPRAGRLLALVDEAARRGAVEGRFAAIGRAVEEALAATKGKRLPMNIDGATAVVLCELGFAPDEGRGLFILSRSVGILAHAMEQKAQGGRIKGPMPPQVPYTYDGATPRTLPPKAAKAGETTP
ncbi:citryl-CoA lyase [Xanthobacter oligotrophicus]|uniref:citryl-CoA lyase n=1 Tax=Xanthobacter oligotrophicus TaxID=2607286 RepID=UPI0011F0FCC2|nr:citryl-CoA lyase [Xanthobacter oligotrophicus]MCG5235779.1 citryl-CoA lyase [Xanthobacter oligotrophicus]